MATAVLPTTDLRGDSRLQADDRHGWGFALLLVTTATLFIRPADLIPVLEDWPVYQFLIVGCLAFSARAIARHLSHSRLQSQPVTVSIVFLMLAIGVSHLSHGFIWGARMSMWEFSKLAAFYLVMVAVITTPRRLYLFIKWLTLAITLVALLALLDRYGIVQISALESIRDRGAISGGESAAVQRIRGTGIFQDPNDFGLILVTGLLLSVCFLVRPKAGLTRYLWVTPIALLLITLVLTHSRGAFLSLACAIPAAVGYRRGVGFALISLLLVPPLGFLLSGRMTDFDAINAGTGQTRIQIWSDCLMLWQQSPLFGMGEGQLFERTGTVAHNSFIHCFAELGLFGGTAFLACFVAAGVGLWKQRSRKIPSSSENLNATTTLPHLQSFIFAALIAYVGGMFFLSRQFVAPTYLILGLATAAQLSGSNNSNTWRFGNRFLLISLASAAGAMLTFHLIVRIFVRW